MSYFNVDNSFAKMKLSDISFDIEIQPRQQLNQEVIAEYAKSMKHGAMFPPIIVFFDGSNYWLADGFHRVKAKDLIRRRKIVANVRPGTRRDALLFSAGVNAVQGLQRTNSDKRKAVEKLILDPEWSHWSDREIARRVSVSQPFVSKLRNRYCSDNGYQINVISNTSSVKSLSVKTFNE